MRNALGHLNSKHAMVCIALLAVVLIALGSGVGGGILLLLVVCPLMMGAMMWMMMRGMGGGGS